VGDVRPTAREFVKLLATATGRPIAYHPQSVDWLYAAELFKWVIKRATGKSVDKPARRDLVSRGLGARFDCDDANTTSTAPGRRPRTSSRRIDITDPVPRATMTKAATRPTPDSACFSTSPLGGRNALRDIADRAGGRNTAT